MNLDDISPMGPFERASIGDPDGEMITALEEKDLAVLLRRVWALADDMDRDGRRDAATYVRATLWIALHNQHLRRRDLEDRARIALEANGHELYLSHDLYETPEQAWYAYCSCGQLAASYPTEQEATTVGDRHIAETGGRWIPDDIELPPV